MMGADLELGPLPRLKSGSAVWAGFSGGLDSTVLLHLLQRRRLPLKAVHVNHHLQPSSGRWAEHCREFCTRLAIPVYVVDVQVDARDPDGPEAAARKSRYAAIRSLMKEGEVLATAHHLDDQAETVLLRLMRGAGVAGLAAMRAQSDFPPGRLWRPLLQRSRDELRQYAEAHRLPWVEDPHNVDPRFSRTFIRQELFPRLRQRWPQAIEMMARSAAHCADAVDALDALAQQDLGGAGAGGGLSVRRLLDLPAPRRLNALRAWASRAGFETPGFEAAARLEAELLRARPDASPVLNWGDTELRRFRDRIFVMSRLPPAPQSAPLEWDGRSDLELPPGCGRLKVLEAPAGELALRVAFPRGGERLKPAGSRFTRTLRNLFQEEGVPGWIRERVPLIHHDGDLVAVGHRWRSNAFNGLCRRSGFQYEWQHDLPGESPARTR